MRTLVEDSAHLDLLESLRDEVQQEIHLGTADVRQHWHGLEKKWARLHRYRKQLRRADARFAGDLRAAIERLAVELGQGYRQIRRMLRERDVVPGGVPSPDAAWPSDFPRVSR